MGCKDVLIAISIFYLYYIYSATAIFFKDDTSVVIVNAKLVVIGIVNRFSYK